jgi:hypothetical protein
MLAHPLETVLAILALNVFAVWAFVAFVTRERT